MHFDSSVCVYAAIATTFNRKKIKRTINYTHTAKVFSINFSISTKIVWNVRLANEEKGRKSPYEWQMDGHNVHNREKFTTCIVDLQLKLDDFNEINGIEYGYI